MTDSKTPISDYVDLVIEVSKELHERLGKLKATPTVSALAAQLMYAMLDAGAHLEVDADPDRITDHIDAETSVPTVGMDEGTERDARLDHYKELLDAAYMAVEHVLSESMRHEDGFIAKDANRAVTGIVSLRSTVTAMADHDTKVVFR